MQRSVVWLFLALLSLGWRTHRGAPTSGGATPEGLSSARRGFTTKLVEQIRLTTPEAPPPSGRFSLVTYDAPLGPSHAYLSSVASDAKGLPAIVWLTGGFPPARGGAYIWTPGPPQNDQSASAFLNAGVVMLFPTVRGAAGNPGFQEAFFGEVEDVIAAANYLRALEAVDPDRVFLGGHSSGATLALLVAESTNLFRAVFAFGPVAELADYGDREWPFDTSNPREFKLRSPLFFLDAIGSPTWIFEGQNGNAEDLAKLAGALANPRVHTLELRYADHFSLLTPITRLLAARVQAQREGVFEVSLEQVEAVSLDFWRSQRESRDLEAIARLRRTGIAWGETVRLAFTLRSRSAPRLDEAGQALAKLGFRPQSILEALDAEGHPCFRLTLERALALDVPTIFAATLSIAESAAKANVIDEGWE